MSKIVTTDIFIDNAKKIHGEKYDYSVTVYRGRHHKLSYICPFHGIVIQEAGAHLQGHECPKCSWGRKQGRCSDTETFIKKAKEVHGDKYDYSCVDYNGYYGLVDIICPTHGHFHQKAYSHLMGYGCIECGRDRTHNNNKSSKDKFIEKAIIKFGNEYDYSLVEYKGCYEPVSIICRKHGVFSISPTYHLIGHKCPKCTSENLIRVNRLSKDDFIQKAKAVHGERYDYSLVEYKSRIKPVAIVCKKHGKFYQTPDSHLLGCGCPRCKQTNGEYAVESFLRENLIDFIREYNIPNENLLCERNFLLADFYLPKLNTIIEYNGEQHYRPVSIYGGEKQFAIQVERDYAMRQYCKEKRIKLIEIPYYDKDNIEIILMKALKIKTRRK